VREPNELLAELRHGTVSPALLFECISAASARFAERGRSDPLALDLTIRLLDARRASRIEPQIRYLVDYLAETAGLFPYLDSERPRLTIRDLVTETHRVRSDLPFVFHAEQMTVFLSLLGGENVVLSAPTSFGKSAIVDFFILERQPATTVIIVPTIALIDETRRRLLRTVGSRFQILFHKDDVRNSDMAIYVMTQERLLDRADIDSVDFFFVDEFYKLDPQRADPRYQLLNIAVYKYSRIARQMFMAGPHISGINFGSTWRGRFTFIQSDYKTVSVDIVDRTSSSPDDALPRFLQDYQANSTALAIAFAASPGSAMDLSGHILQIDDSSGSEAATEMAEWLAENYSPHWGFVSRLRRGIGLHHGRLPRSVAQRVIELFEAADLKILVCTSTLIEGVNTSAAIVYVYDKRINTTDFDFFSFANIRGRAGRMMRHFVGKVFLYHQPPEEIATVVDVPIYSDPDSASEPILFAIDDAEVSPAGAERRDEISEQTGLSPEIIRRFGSMGVDNLASLKIDLEKAIGKSPSLVLWSGFPDKDQRDFLFTVLFKRLFRPNRSRIGARSGPQLSFFVYQLQRISSLAKFFSWLTKTNRARSQTPEGESVEIGFEFLRACDFLVPNAMAAAEAIVNLLRPDGRVNWSYYIVLVENCFRPAWVKALEERGLPMPLAERLREHLDDDASVEEAISFVLALREGPQISEFSSVEQRLFKRFA
jgi:hypothetical protein